MESMRSPLKILILLGLICQGMTWDNYYALSIYCILWFFLNILNLKRKLIGESLEIIILLTGFTIFYLYAGNNLFEKCIALGNGLAVLQIIRLTYKLDYRKKVLAFAMATTQIAIGTQTFLNYSFLIILILLVVLIPKYFYSIQSAEYIELPNNKTKFSIFRHKFEFTLILIISILFFLFFPRVNFESNSRFYQDIGMSKDSLTLTKPILKTSLEGVSEDDLDKEELLFQVYADKLTYLKVLSMDKFNGDLWTISSYGYLHKRNFRKRRNLVGCNYRKIDVKYDNFKSRFLPADGDVFYIKGNFFDDPTLTRLGNLVVTENINRKNKTFEYWCKPYSKATYLSEKYKKTLTKIKDVSPKLETWLTDLVKDEKSKYDKALSVKNYLKSNYKYELGAPELDKEYPIENFIFNEKKGHCERFASALAVLLRMLDIPTIVTVGYRARERNEVGNYYNIRAGDAHAWTEAYFDNTGWIILDSTPVADYIENTAHRDKGVRWMLDYIEYVWYSKIVNLSYGEQLQLYSSVGSFIKFLSTLLNRYFIYFLLVFGLVFFVLIFCRLPNVKAMKFKYSFRIKRKRDIKLNHFYGSMIRIMLKHKIRKQDTLTPNEFLIELKKQNIVFYNEVEYITNIFCKMKYGNKRISEEELGKVEKLIAFLKKQKII